MKKIDYIVLSFLNFLNTTNKIFQDLKKLIEDSDYLDGLQNDYLQANWEIIVESLICEPGIEFLQVYGEGADCNEISSRVCFPEKLATHIIKVKPKIRKEILDRNTNEKIETEDYFFNSFVSHSNKEDNSKPVYNSILLEHKNEDKYVVVDVIDVFFEMEQKQQ